MSVTIEVFRFSIPSIASNFSHSINQELQDVGRADANETSKYNSDNISFMLSNPLRFLIVIHFILSIAQLALLIIIKGERLDRFVIFCPCLLSSISTQFAPPRGKR